MHKSLYYMKTKKVDPDFKGYKFFHWDHLEKPGEYSYDRFDSTDDIEQSYSKWYLKQFFLKPKEMWEPFLTQDRELVKYHPKKSISILKAHIDKKFGKNKSKKDHNND